LDRRQLGPLTLDRGDCCSQAEPGHFESWNNGASPDRYGRGSSQTKPSTDACETDAAARETSSTKICDASSQFRIGDYRRSKEIDLSELYKRVANELIAKQKFAATADRQDGDQMPAATSTAD
jgi:hypothetical protein